MKTSRLQVKIGNSKRVGVISVDHAKQQWIKYRDLHNLGSSESPNVFLYLSGSKVGHISYNGRAWASTGEELDAGL